MKEILRNTFAAMVGAVTGIILITAIQIFSQSLYPLPEGLSPADKVAMGEFIRTLPGTALMLVFASYFVGVTVGAWLAGRLSFTAHRRQVIMVTLLFTAASVMNLLSFSHPVWFWAANFAAVIGGGWLALKFVGHPPAPANL